MTEYLPEGFLICREENARRVRSAEELRGCIGTGEILEAPCVICDSRHNLIVDLGCMRGIIPREEGALGIREGTTKDIALISRVNKPVCFTVTDVTEDEYAAPVAILSRRAAQEQCMNDYISGLRAGDVIPARVTHLEHFGAFVDIGCGIPSLIPIDLISVSRISHPADRFRVGQDIFAAVRSIEGERVCLSHKELLGTWQENADMFEAGETVTGVVRSVEDYGIFVELAPNLAGLAEPREGVYVGNTASVYIKAIIPEKMKIKLIIVSASENTYCDNELHYFISSGHIDRWLYSGDECEKRIESVFGD